MCNCFFVRAAALSFYLIELFAFGIGNMCLYVFVASRDVNLVRAFGLVVSLNLKKYSLL